MSTKDTLTMTEAGALLGISAQMMGRLKERDKIEHEVWPDGTIHFKPEVIRRYKQHRAENPRPSGRPRKQVAAAIAA